MHVWSKFSRVCPCGIPLARDNLPGRKKVVCVKSIFTRVRFKANLCLRSGCWRDKPSLHAHHGEDKRTPTDALHEEHVRLLPVGQDSARQAAGAVRNRGTRQTRRLWRSAGHAAKTHRSQICQYMPIQSLFTKNYFCNVYTTFCRRSGKYTCLTGKSTALFQVPRIFIGGKSVGGSSELKALRNQEKLVPMLKEANASFADNTKKEN